MEGILRSIDKQYDVIVTLCIYYTDSNCAKDKLACIPAGLTESPASAVFTGYSFVVAEDISEGRLIRLFPDHEAKQLGIYAVYTHRRHRSAKIRLFIEMLQDRMKDQAVF